MLLLRLADLLIQLRGKDETIQCFVVGVEDVVTRTLPLFLAAFEEDNVVAYLHNGVHVVGVDDGADVILAGDILDEFVNNQRGLRIQA